MNTHEYLSQMESALKGLSDDEKASLLEEISSHLSEGQTDPQLGEDETPPLDRLAIEMGNPIELGRRLKQIHHPNRWLEYLMIVIPNIFVLPLIYWIITLLFPSNLSLLSPQKQFLYASIRVSIVVQIGLVILGVLIYKRQGSITGLIYWLSSIWLSIFSMCYREERWSISGTYNQSPGGLAESIFLNLFLIGLLIWLSRILWKIRDPLWFTFVALPFLTSLGNLVTAQVLLSGVFPNGYTLPDWRLGWFGLPQITVVIWPAIFIFPKQRIFRWLALLVNAFPFALMNIIASSHHPYLITLWVFPVLLVVINWISDSLSLKVKSKSVL
ncbi:MAG: hypothetical protein JW908_16680 [Anaerolineales bacterium]|nr:hypothetical protein [Anaerolineales bacterium]